MAKTKKQDYDWCCSLDNLFTEHFGEKYRIETHWNVVLGSCVSKRVDGKPLSELQRAFIDGFMARHDAYPA